MLSQNISENCCACAANDGRAINSLRDNFGISTKKIQQNGWHKQKVFTEHARWNVKEISLWRFGFPVADPGFPQGLGANSKGGCEKLLFSQFSA